MSENIEGRIPIRLFLPHVDEDDLNAYHGVMKITNNCVISPEKSKPPLVLNLKVNIRQVSVEWSKELNDDNLPLYVQDLRFECITSTGYKVTVEKIK